MRQGVEEELRLRLCQLFVFLSHLEVQLVKLYTQPAAAPEKLALLADEACELKRMAREATGWLDVPPGSVPPSSPAGGEAFSEAVDQRRADGDADADEGVFRDGHHVDSSKHAEGL